LIAAPDDDWPSGCEQKGMMSLNRKVSVPIPATWRFLKPQSGKTAFSSPWTKTSQRWFGCTESRTPGFCDFPMSRPASEFGWCGSYSNATPVTYVRKPSSLFEAIGYAFLRIAQLDPDTVFGERKCP